MCNWISRFTVYSPPMLTGLLSEKYDNIPKIVHIEKQVTEEDF